MGALAPFYYPPLPSPPLPSLTCVLAPLISDLLGVPCYPPSSGSSSSSGLSAGSGLVIAFVCILFVYVVGGVIYNYRIGSTGVELLPHYSFWRGLPGLVTAGFRFSFLECFGLRSSTSSYQPV